MAEKKLKTLQFEGLNTTYVLPEVDPTSSISGDAADAKIVGDHLTDINNPHGVTLEQLGASKTIVTDENQDGNIVLKSYLSDSGSGNISTHISDRSNPHKVTAVQVGADVSGAAKQALEDAKGYTDEVITNLIGGAPDTLNTLQELAEAMEVNAEVVDVLERAITGKADNSTLTAHIDNKNNPHNVTLAQIGAAPAGYGLGTYGQLLTADHNLNDSLPTGLYRWGASVPVNAPSPIGYAVMLHIARTDGDSIQKVWHLGTHPSVQISCERYLTDNNGEWEWVNPPMTLGVEYRTTKRYDGHVVYTQMISCGKGPASGGANYYLNLNTNNIIFTQIRCKAVSPTSYWGAFLDHYISFGEYGSGAPCVSLSANAGDQSNRNIYLIVEYYKV